MKTQRTREREFGREMENNLPLNGPTRGPFTSHMKSLETQRKIMLRDGIYRRVIQGEGTVSCVPQREKSSPWVKRNKRLM